MYLLLFFEGPHCHMDEEKLFGPRPLPLPQSAIPPFHQVFRSQSLKNEAFKFAWYLIRIH